jgi:hypothetical protein
MRKGKIILLLDVKLTSTGSQKKVQSEHFFYFFSGIWNCTTYYVIKLLLLGEHIYFIFKIALLS